MMNKMTLEDLKIEEDIAENELKHFTDSLANSLASKFEFTLDYFDTSIGILYSADNPTSLNFSVALLREILSNLKPNHELWDKIKYAAFILNLATRNVEFNLLYQIYHQIEVDVQKQNFAWTDKEVEMYFDSKITEKLIVKDDVCSLPDIDASKSDLDLYAATSPLNENSDNYIENINYDDSLVEHEDYSDKFGEDSTVQILKDEIKKTERKEVNGSSKAKRKATEKSSVLKKKPRISKRKVNVGADNKDEVKDIKLGEEEIKYPCHLCKYKARTSSDLEKHAFEKHDANRLCTQCGHLSDTYKDFIKHNETHLFTCEICHKKLLGVRVLKAHMKLHQSKEEAPGGGGSALTDTPKVPCDICGVLLQELSLKHHIAQVHSNEIHQCDVCDFTANTKYKITDHRKRHFGTMSTCPECGKTVKNLKRHFRRNCGGKRERHFCHLCEKSFSFKESLTKHIKSIHQKILDHHCHLCEYKTYKKFNLKLHISKMHTKEEMKKLCTYCNQNTSNLEYHIKIYHYDEEVKNMGLTSS